MLIAQERQTREDLKDFIRQELTMQFAESDNRFAQFRQEQKAEFAQVRHEMNERFAATDVKFAELRTEMHATQKDLAYKLIATIVAVTSLGIAIVKLFPNAH